MHMHLLWLLGFSILLVVVYLVAFSHVRGSSPRSRINQIPVALLFCTVNTEERRSMHEDVILWWLDHEPTFDIFIVDSTTNSFHPRIESQCRICHFDQTALPNYEQIKDNSTALELKALQEAQDHFALEWTSYTYVIKLTPKYKLPTLHTTLERVIHDDSTDRFVQSIHFPEIQNTELFVVKASLFPNMLSLLNLPIYKMNDEMEGRFYYYNMHNTMYKRLPKLPNVAKYKRSFGDFLDHL